MCCALSIVKSRFLLGIWRVGALVILKSCIVVFSCRFWKSIHYTLYNLQRVCILDTRRGQIQNGFRF